MAKLWKIVTHIEITMLHFEPKWKVGKRIFSRSDYLVHFQTFDVCLNCIFSFSNCNGNILRSYEDITSDVETKIHSALVACTAATKESLNQENIIISVWDA